MIVLACLFFRVQSFAPTDSFSESCPCIQTCRPSPMLQPNQSRRMGAQSPCPRCARLAHHGVHEQTPSASHSPQHPPQPFALLIDVAFNGPKSRNADNAREGRIVTTNGASFYHQPGLSVRGRLL